MEPRPRPQGHTGLLSRLRALPPIVLIALLLVMLGAGIVLGSMTLHHTGTVTRTVTGDLAELSVVAPAGDDPVTLGTDAIGGTVVYTVTNLLPVAVNVTAVPDANALLVLTVDKPTFSLGAYAAKEVTLTMTFTDTTTLSAGYELDFTSTRV